MAHFFKKGTFLLFKLKGKSRYCKFRNWNKLRLTCTKLWKLCYFMQNCTPELFVTLKRAYSCCFSITGNQDFQGFLQKKFYNIDYCSCISKLSLSYLQCKIKAVGKCIQSHPISLFLCLFLLLLLFLPAFLYLCGSFFLFCSFYLSLLLSLSLFLLLLLFLLLYLSIFLYLWIILFCSFFLFCWFYFFTFLYLFLLSFLPLSFSNSISHFLTFILPLISLLLHFSLSLSSSRPVLLF